MITNDLLDILNPLIAIQIHFLLCLIAENGLHSDISMTVDAL